MKRHSNTLKSILLKLIIHPVEGEVVCFAVQAVLAQGTIKAVKVAIRVTKTEKKGQSLVNPDRDTVNIQHLGLFVEAQ